jgi:glycosyltransferase involved in cell wall biosynthesis
MQAKLAPRRAVRVVHPGIELERFDAALLPAPREARARLGLPQDRPLVGIVGRLQHWKGMHVLIAAMAQLPGAHCVVVGGTHDLEPGYRAQLERQIAALGLGRSVALAGMQNDVGLWMQAMDVVVHASDREPFGIVILEAMALAKPVVAGSEGGPREIIRDGVDGLLTPFGDHDALARAIRRYLDDPGFAHTTGKAARIRAADFGVERFASGVVTTVSELTGQRRQELR